MTKKNSTKKALITSVLSLLLCFSMLLGTTFAWFTDSVTSANNIIMSGNLDVELYYQVEGQSDWTKVTEATNIFKAGVLWEPGHTEVVKLKVVNEGTLALKYNLGVNVASEVGSVNVEGDPFMLSDHIRYGIVNGAQSYTRDEAIAAAEAVGATALKTAYNSGTTALDAKNDTDSDEKIVTMVVYMPTSVGNEANPAKGAATPTINLGLTLFATQQTVESDAFGSDFDAVVKLAYTQAQAQEVLDNAVPGTTLYLMEGANYGTLYLRPSANTEVTKTIDWQGNNYGWETYSCFENLTIIGAEGSTIDAIEIEGGTYYHTEHSQDDAYPVMLSLVELKNVVIDGVTFTGKGGYDPQGHGNAINLSGNNIKVDGLSVKNCVLKDADNNARLIYKTESTTHVHTYTYGGESFTFTPSLKDITVTGTTFDGGYMGLELRETENVTITNNVFNVGDRNILLPVNTGYTYSGTITITGNVSNYAQERFVRADGTGDAVVVITGNTINNYVASDTDYIKVTNGNNVTIENNPMTRAYKASTVDELKDRLAAGGKIVLANNIVMDKSINLSNADFVLDGNGHTITMADGATNTYALFDITGGKATIKNITFDGIKEGAIVRTVGVEFNADKVTAVNGNHTQVQGIFRLMGKSTIENCTFKNNTCNMVISLNYDGANNDPQVVKNCVFEKNTCNATAVVYYVKGASATVDGNKFVENNVTVTGTSNAATLYMGFQENTTITNNVFENNTVNGGTSKRVAGAIMIGYEAVITGNSFVGNKVTGENAKANDVAAAAYYTDIDLSGNYWGGSAPVENDDYYNEYPNNHSVIINDYLTMYGN